MFNVKYIPLALLSLSQLSCLSKSNNLTHLYIDNSNIKLTQDISNKIDLVNINPLIEVKDNHIGNVYKILITKHNYIIFDRLNTNKVLLFSKSGQFIKTIAKSGDAPTDQLNITDCWLNNSNNLEVYDFAQMKIFQYDSKFNFYKVISSNWLYHFSGLRNIPYTNKYIGYSNYSDYNKLFNNKLYQIAFLDSNLNIVATDRDFDKIYQGVLWPIFKSHFTVFKDSLRFMKAYDNFIYTVSNSILKERFKIVYNKNQLPDDVTPIIKQHLIDFKNQFINPNINAAYFKKYARFAGTWLENDKYIYLSSRDTTGNFGDLFYSLIDKSTYKEIYNARSLIESKRYNLELPPFEYFDEITNEYISVADGVQLKNRLFANSIFLNSVVSDSKILYLIKVKFKR